jgi:hypothetical protein
LVNDRLSVPHARGGAWVDLVYPVDDTIVGDRPIADEIEKLKQTVTSEPGPQKMRFEFSVRAPLQPSL